MNYKTFSSKISLANRELKPKYAGINEEINNDNYHYIVEKLLPNIIKKHNNRIMITENIIKSYSNKLTKKEFTGDNILFEMRKLNKLDNIIPNKIDYILKDNSRIFIDYKTQEIINNVLGEHIDIIDYMKQNITNFSQTINQIKGYI